MSRFSGFFLGVGLLIGISSGQALALGPLNAGQHLRAPHQSLIVQVRKPLTERQKCKALNRCRQIYTHCENKLAAQHKLNDLDEKCVKPYQKCIRASFSGGEWFFTRWFNPSYLDCSKYPG